MSLCLLSMSICRPQHQQLRRVVKSNPLTDCCSAAVVVVVIFHKTKQSKAKQSNHTHTLSKMEAAALQQQQHKADNAAASADNADDAAAALRFEDLTVDDDLPIIDRIVHYTSSQIALQRLVHIKMLAETAELAGYVYV